MSTSRKAIQRGTILNEIMQYKRERLPSVIRDVPLEDLRALVAVAPPTVDFKKALAAPGVSLIAECKKASPTKGLIAPDYHPLDLAAAYVRAGARAISVLTDSRFFQGSLADLRDIKEMLLDPSAESFGKLNAADKVPVLRKDFIFHPYQVYEARAAGADAVLLIASILGGNEFGSLLSLVHELEMAALVEVHDEEELKRILPYNPGVVGINNRNLQTFEVDFQNTARLRNKIPESITVVAESGIQSGEDVHRLRDIGVDAILVGESLVRSKDAFETASILVQAGMVE